MKKLLLTSVFAVALAFTAAAASGPVNLDNVLNGGGSIYVLNTSTLAPAGTQVQVFAGATLLSTDNGNTFSTLSDPLQGKFFGGTANDTGVANNGTATFTIHAWTGAATYELAQVTPGAYYGSVSWTQTVGDSGSLATPPSLTNPNVIMVAGVPEPTTVVLGALGGLALLARRRRQA